MKNKVTVKGDKNKNVITVSEKNPEFGWLTVEQDVFQISDRGWLKSTTRTALIHGRVEDLKEAGYTAGTELPGKIVVIESLTPFSNQNPDVDLKIAGNTGVICRLDDQPIYRKAFFTTNQNMTDEFITHTNTDEIREVMEAQKMLDILKNEPSKEEVEL